MSAAATGAVLVDTPIWSLMLRRKTATAPESVRLRELAQRGLVRIIGPVRQEILSGIRTSEQFARLRSRLRSFPDFPLNESHFERAAEFYNLCRSKGVQGSNTDFLLCAVAELHQMQIFTTDNDFTLFVKHLPIELLR